MAIYGTALLSICLLVGLLICMTLTPALLRALGASGAQVRFGALFEALDQAGVRAVISFSSRERYFDPFLAEALDDPVVQLVDGHSPVCRALDPAQ